MHAVKASTATAGGRLADAYGKRNALALGWTVYALTWSAVGVASSVPVLFGLVALYGTSHGLVEGAVLDIGLCKELTNSAVGLKELAAQPGDAADLTARGLAMLIIFSRLRWSRVRV
jgi:MFS family permease